MGRNQAFETASVVRAARDVFWDRGFEATTVADLEEATGLRRSSLYHCFGNKRGLFDAAVGDYLAAVVRPRLAVLRSGAADSSALVEYFDTLRTAIGELGQSSRGCLLVNCAAGLAAHDTAACAVVDGYRAELTGALRDALAAASTDPGAALLDSRVRTLAACSMSAMLLARVNRTEAVALLTTACDLVMAWTVRSARVGD
jgi:AcrR family transcriptional regulator